MPLWKVYHPVGAYSVQDKREFAEKVTEMYSRIPIPKFYVVMIFEEVAAESVYVGGVSHGKFVRFKLDHMARTLPGPILREWWVKAVDQLIAPVFVEIGQQRFRARRSRMQIAVHRAFDRHLHRRSLFESCGLRPVTEL